MKYQRQIKIMRSPDMFDKDRQQIFDCKTGDFLYYSKHGQNFNINEDEPEHIEPETENINQLELF